MKNIVILGNTDFGRMLKYYIELDDDRKIEAFTVSREYIEKDTFCDLPVVAFEDIENFYPPEKYEILLAIGNSKMNDVRKKMFYECKKKGYTIATYIHSSCSVHTKDIGEGNIILENCLLYPFSKLGKCNLLWDHVSISHDCEVGDFNTFASYSDLCGYVKIGNNGYFGKHCIIDVPEIADYTLVGAAAYAKVKTKEYDVVVPVRSFVLENKKSTDLM